LGGWWAWPGGKLETNDRYEEWCEDLPAAKNFTDFNLRMSAIRETFEEVNLLLTDKAHKPGMQKLYLEKYGGDFRAFCTGE